MPRAFSPADVAIVGAGPAGAWAARALAIRGARVLILDASHPREKPCGGGVTGRALARVQTALGATACPAVAVREARFTDPIGGRTATVTLETNRTADPLVVVSRAAFDARLLQAAIDAGATFQATRVLDVARDGARVRLTTTGGPVVADWVVGADGANSLVRRRLSRLLPRDQLSIATGYFAHGVSSDAIVLEFTTQPAGYLWSFPRPTHLAVGICAQADTSVGVQELRARAGMWLRRTGLADGARLEAYAWPIPSLTVEGLADNRVSGSGWCLVGDAAGLVDPITREGISLALESADLAAAALTGHGRPAQAYASAIADTITPELRRAARLKARFFSPGVTALLLDAVRQSAAIRRVLADLVAGQQPYSDLAWRLAKTLEVGLARKALAQWRSSPRR